MRKLNTYAAAIVVLFAAAVMAGAQQMQPYTSTDGRFTVNFPKAAIQTNNQSISLGSGGTTTLYQIYVELDNQNVSYMLMYNDYPANYANGDPQAVLATTRDGAVGKKTLVSDIAISLNGVPGREFTSKDSDWNYTVRQYLSGKRLYQLIVVSNTAHPATQISDFMNSFRIQ